MLDASEPFGSAFSCWVKTKAECEGTKNTEAPVVKGGDGRGTFVEGGNRIL